LSQDDQPVTWEDAAVMTWGGLRGAVGLALAISVKIDRAPHICTKELGITQKDGERLLFYVAGVAFLTMIVNATSAPMLVSRLGITALPHARQTLLKMFHQQLVNWSVSGENPPEVTEALKQMLHEAEEEIDHQNISQDGPKCNRSNSDVKPVDEQSGQTNKEILAEYETSKNIATTLVKQMFPGEHEDVAFDLVVGDDDTESQEQKKIAESDVGEMIQLISDQWVDVGMAKVVNQCFLTLVMSNYWKLLDEGELRPGSLESEVLLTSVRVALSPLRPDLEDFPYVQHHVSEDVEFKDDTDGMDENPLSDSSMHDVTVDTPLAKLIASAHFNLSVAVVILLNTIQVMCEELFRDNCDSSCGNVCVKADIDDHVVWLILDIIFTTFFCIEFGLKFGWMRCSYFKDNWNRFDFFLVIVGLFGLIASAATR
jgi:hypothetical protein